MKNILISYCNGDWNIDSQSPNLCQSKVGLFLCFGDKDLMQPDLYSKLRSQFENAQIAMVSSAGEIFQSYAQEQSMVGIGLQFENTTIHSVSTSISMFNNSFDIGQHIIQNLNASDLTYIMLFSDCDLVNGSELIEGISRVNNTVLITGGLAGDGHRFESPIIGLNEPPTSGNVIAIGFYGESIKIQYGSESGWQTFGIERTITKSDKNIVYEIDGESALDLYRKYIGSTFKSMHCSTLLFPISLPDSKNKSNVVRTVVNIREKDEAMVFSGNMPEGSRIKLMRTNFNNLHTAAEKAAKNATKNLISSNAVGLLFSSLGRKISLGPRIDDEIAIIRKTLGNYTPVIGYFSYGEISPLNEGGDCQVQNQTMTITTIYENTSMAMNDKL